MGSLKLDANKVSSYVLPKITDSKNEIKYAYQLCNKIEGCLPTVFSYRHTLSDMSGNLYYFERRLNILRDNLEKKISNLKNIESKSESKASNLTSQISQLNFSLTKSAIVSATVASKSNSDVKSVTQVSMEKEDTGAKISTKVSSFFKNVFSGMKNVAAKISNYFSSVFKKKESTNKDVVNSVADETKDKNGLFEKTTLLDEAGSRIVYKRKEKLEDGTIEYYGENDKLVKKINPDGSCEFYTGCEDYYYSAEGKKIGGTWTSSAFGININKILVSSDGTKEYYGGSKLKRKEFVDGTYEKYYEESLQNVREVCIPDGSSKKYKEYKGEYYLAGEYNVDGSHKLYNSNNQLIEELNADGSCKVYSNKLWDKELQKFIFDDNKTTLSYEKKADGKEYEYTYNKFGYLTIKCSDGSEKCYDNNNIFISEKLSDGTRKTYYKESGKIDGIENPDGSKKYYYENGNLRSEIDSAGNEIEYREDGTKRTEIKNNETIFYDEKGNVKDHTKSDGSSVNYWDDGTKVITYSDGSSKRYYPSGKLAFEKDINGIQISYYENGVISQKGNSDGSYTTYDESGKPNMTIYPDGNVEFH